MPFEKLLLELLEMIRKFLEIHANPYDTSKHDATAEKLEKIYTALSKVKTTSSLVDDDFTNTTSEEKDICDILNTVYPSQNIITIGSSRYDEFKEQLRTNIFKNDNGSAIYKKVQNAGIYFIKATSKDCFNSTNLANLKPCRFNELKSYQYICLTSSDNFSTMQLYDISGVFVASIAETKQLYEDKWVEKEKEVETLNIAIKEKIDFYIKKLLLEDENGKVLDKIDFKEPTILEGTYQNFETKAFNEILTDTRAAFLYEDKKNKTTKRKTIIHLIGSQKESLRKEIVLEGMQKKVKLTIQHDYSINKLEISTDLDFDKWYLNEKYQTIAPALSNGGGLLKFGAGLPKGNYTIYLAENKKESNKYQITKDTKNGHIEVLFDLSKLSSTNWETQHIISTIKTGELSVCAYLNSNIFTNIVSLISKYDADNHSDVLDSINILTTDFNNLVSIASDLASENIPFVNGICAIISFVGTFVSSVKKEIDKQEANANKIAAQKHVEDGIAYLNEQIAKIASDKGHKYATETCNYYLNKTKGKATTSMICSDIENKFSKIIPRK